MKFRSIALISFSVVLFWGGCENSSNSGPAEVENFPCEDGMAAGLYPCNNIGLYAHIGLDQLGAVRANDIWGWTDPSNNKEYALIGLYDGIGFVDISNPNEPVYVGKLNEYSASLKLAPEKAKEEFPACTFGIGTSEVAKIQGEGSTWRDVKVYNNHAFVVADGQIHGMQVFDLTKLRNYNGTFMEFSEDAHYDLIDNVHNIAINEATGFAYLVGYRATEACGFARNPNVFGARDTTGLHIVDISSPLSPQFAGCYIDHTTENQSAVNAGTAYIHDTQCVNYNGSDSEHTGKEVCFSSAEGSVVITDVTDKNNPTTLGFSGASQMQYSHQGWLTEDHRYFLMNDEIDEGNLGRDTKTYIWDVQNLEEPIFVGHYTHDTPTIDHNLYIKDNLVYQSNYTSGLRVFRLGDLSRAELIPVGYFDTEPSSNAVTYDGAWSNYPFFKSGVIIVSDINRGLFILRPNL
ncbi:MAG: choice-of-anchor B family protein [Balneolales bacterium]|nr:choice-of-anchor B family protein [Balneolales bacterium]